MDRCNHLHIRGIRGFLFSFQGLPATAVIALLFAIDTDGDGADDSVETPAPIPL
jgi:hypothetical protein